MTGAGGWRGPSAAPDDTLPLTRETLSALRDGRLSREQARDVRARLFRDPAALALLGTLGSAAPAEGTSSKLTAGTDQPVPPRAGTRAHRVAVVAVAVVAAVAALLWARHVSVPPPDPRAAPEVPEVTMAELATLWPAMEGHFDRDLLDDRETCVVFRVPVAVQGVVVDGRYSMVVAYGADGVRSDEIVLLVVPLNCNSSDFYPQVTVPR